MISAPTRRASPKVAPFVRRRQTPAPPTSGAGVEFVIDSARARPSNTVLGFFRRFTTVHEPGVSPGSLFRAITRVSLRSVFSEKFQAPGSWLTMMYLRSYEEVKSFRVRDQATPDNKP